jgi:hypothetical protein
MLDESNRQKCRSFCFFNCKQCNFKTSIILFVLHAVKTSSTVFLKLCLPILPVLPGCWGSLTGGVCKKESTLLSRSYDRKTRMLYFFTTLIGQLSTNFKSCFHASIHIGRENGSSAACQLSRWVISWTIQLSEVKRYTTAIVYIL